MKITLIPIIEISNVHEDIECPFKGSPSEWDAYYAACHQKAGFKDTLKPFISGHSFYELSGISDNNLKKLLIDKIQYFNDIEVEDRDEINNIWFDGGYVLQIDGENIYFPQCCCDLSEIGSWEGLLEGNTSFYHGHPSPKVHIDENKISFDFVNHDYEGEGFELHGKLHAVEFSKKDLKEAIEIAKKQLTLFEHRVEQLSIKHQLNIQLIDNQLVYVFKKRFEKLERVPQYDVLPILGGYGNGYPVQFFKKDGSSWVANLPTGNGGCHAIIDYPEKDRIIVIAAGALYVICPEIQEILAIYDWDIQQIFQTDDGKIVAASGTDIFIFNYEGLLWSQRVSCDGIIDLQLNGNLLSGLSFNTSLEQYVPFTINLGTKMVQGGSCVNGFGI
jgi:hypothetical protein